MTEWASLFDATASPVPTATAIVAPIIAVDPLGLRPYQREAMEAVLAEFDKGVQRTLATACTGCHAAGQLILMADGGLVPVETLMVNDLVMGVTGPQKVTALIRGRGEMYRVTPLRFGNPFLVNGDHILTLVHTNRSGNYPLNGTIIDVSVKEYLRWPKPKKHLYKLFRVPVPKFLRCRRMPTLSPYHAGMLLGDGTLGQGSIELCTGDSEIVVELSKLAKQYRCRLLESPNSENSKSYRLSRVKGLGNPLIDALEGCRMRGMRSGTKYIPHVYKIASIADRLELLAGLMDTDGSLSSRMYDYISKSKALADDVAFVARSVGLSASVRACIKTCQTGNGGIYHRVSIGGKCWKIPCRVARKRILDTTKKQKNLLRTGFSVEAVGEGEYFGFSLNGDGRFLLDDFTVTHNSGKTIFASHIIDRVLETWGKGKKVLIVVHRNELLEQANRKIKAITGHTPGIEKAQNFARQHARVVIASIQSLISVSKRTKKRRIEDRFNPHDYALLWVDEVHRYVAPAWRKAIEWMYTQNPDLKLLGVTATPKRGDNKAMGMMFQSVAFQYPIMRGINDGWIVPIRQTSVRVEGLDLSKVRTTAGDLNEGELAEILEYEKVLHEMATPVLDLAKGRQTLVFCITVAHAERFAEILNRHTPGCAAMVCGRTPEEKRSDLFTRFGRREFQVLTNVGVATEGTDLPGVEVIVMARPTKSAALHEQMLGRGLRPAEAIAEVLNTLPDAAARRECIAASEKPAAHIIDFVGNCGKHKLITVADVLGGDYSDEVKARAAKKARESGVPADVAALLKSSAEEISMEQIRKRMAEERERDRRRGVVAKSEYRTGSVDPFDYYQVSRPRLTSWDGLPRATGPQVEFLRRRGFTMDWAKLTRGEAGRMITACAGKVTQGQAKVLTRAGYSADELRSLTTQQASKLIDAVKNNRWKRVEMEAVA